jgi:hypothetical protein
MSRTSSDLELVYDREIQTVGLRFSNVTLPPGATVVNAYIQFQVDEISTDAAVLTIQGQAEVNPVTFENTNGDISNRTRTTAAANWIPDHWTIVGQAGLSQQTPDIAPVIQEIINLPGWVDGSSLVFIITGTGSRVAESFNGNQAAAPLLHVEYIIGN